MGLLPSKNDYVRYKFQMIPAFVKNDRRMKK